MTNPPTTCCICEAPAALPHCACPECLAIASSAVDPGEAAALVRLGVYMSDLDAFESLVITHLDAAMNGDVRLGGGAL